MRAEMDEVVATYPNEAEARFWAGILQGEGIRSVLVPLGAGAGLTGTATWLPHELRVLTSDVEKAREVLAG